MVRVSVLHDCLLTMRNAEKRGKRQVLIRPASKVIIKFLQVMMKHGYIGEFEVIDDRRAGKIVVNLIGRINKCGCISPRFDVKVKEIEKWVNNLLPSRQFGFIVLTTSYGIMDHEEARKKHTGGCVHCLAIHPSGKSIAVSHQSGSVRIYSMKVFKKRIQDLLRQEKEKQKEEEESTEKEEEETTTTTEDEEEIIVAKKEKVIVLDNTNEEDEKEKKNFQNNSVNSIFKKKKEQPKSNKQKIEQNKISSSKKTLIFSDSSSEIEITIDSEDEEPTNSPKSNFTNFEIREIEEEEDLKKEINKEKEILEGEIEIEKEKESNSEEETKSSSPSEEETSSPDGDYFDENYDDNDIEEHFPNVLLADLKGHKGIVNILEFSPDGNLLATCSDDHSIIIWKSKFTDIDKLIRERTKLKRQVIEQKEGFEKQKQYFERILKSKKNIEQLIFCKMFSDFEENYSNKEATNFQKQNTGTCSFKENQPMKELTKIKETKKELQFSVQNSTKFNLKNQTLLQNMIPSKQQKIHHFLSPTKIKKENEMERERENGKDYNGRLKINKQNEIKKTIQKIIIKKIQEKIKTEIKKQFLENQNIYLKSKKISDTRFEQRIKRELSEQKSKTETALEVLKNENIEPWEIVTKLEQHKGDVQGLAWSPDSNFLASCSIDNKIIIWDLSNFSKPTKNTKLTENEKVTENEKEQKKMKEKEKEKEREKKKEKEKEKEKKKKKEKRKEKHKKEDNRRRKSMGKKKRHKKKKKRKKEKEYHHHHKHKQKGKGKRKRKDRKKGGRRDKQQEKHKKKKRRENKHKHQHKLLEKEKEKKKEKTKDKLEITPNQENEEESKKVKIVLICDEHKNVIKGITWSPNGLMFASQDPDLLLIHSVIDQKILFQITKPFKHAPDVSIFTKPCFSPNGNYLIIPGCVHHKNQLALIVSCEKGFLNLVKPSSKKHKNQFSNKAKKRELLIDHLYGHSAPVTVVSFSPIFYKSRVSRGTKQLFALGAQDGTISLWMLNKKYPIGVITGLFNQAIEDIHWSKDGDWFSVCAGNSIGFFEIQPGIDFPSDIEQLSMDQSKVYSQKHHILNSKGKMPRISNFFTMQNRSITLKNNDDDDDEENNKIQKKKKSRKHKHKHGHISRRKHLEKYNHNSPKKKHKPEQNEKNNHINNNKQNHKHNNHQKNENNNKKISNQNSKNSFDKENFPNVTQKEILQKIDQTQSSIKYIQDTILSKPTHIVSNYKQILKSLEGKKFAFTITIDNDKRLKINCENKIDPKNGKRMSIITRSLGDITLSIGAAKHVSYIGGNDSFLVISLDYCILNIESLSSKEKNKNWIFITSDFYSNIQFVNDHYLVLVFPSGKCNVFDLEKKIMIFDQSIPNYYIGTKIKSIGDFIPNVSPLITFYDNLKYFYNKNILNWEIYYK
ncbi:protein hira [Anaeramoeba flamelloides]|uniref:Protein hira n=1 Tax=Anaeramoeba flamelloides TaxID=1746091 RepID=A0ABQ8XMD9_9EUKA|nr:protein hira [Anaeramoeba flamelloides]